MMNFVKITLKTITILATTILTVSCEKNNISKPEIFEFGASKKEIIEKIKLYCETIEERTIEPIQLPTALNSQTQLDCTGFVFAGKKRKVELVFADDRLDMIWILTEAEEEKGFIEKFTNSYGAPTHIVEDATFYINNGAAVRNMPHEILFISERLKEPYLQWLNNSK